MPITWSSLQFFETVSSGKWGGKLHGRKFMSGPFTFGFSRFNVVSTGLSLPYYTTMTVKSDACVCWCDLGRIIVSCSSYLVEENFNLSDISSGIKSSALV